MPGPVVVVYRRDSKHIRVTLTTILRSGGRDAHNMGSARPGVSPRPSYPGCPSPPWRVSYPRGRCVALSTVRPSPPWRVVSYRGLGGPHGLWSARWGVSSTVLSGLPLTPLAGVVSEGSVCRLVDCSPLTPLAGGVVWDDTPGVSGGVALEDGETSHKGSLVGGSGGTIREASLLPRN